MRVREADLTHIFHIPVLILIIVATIFYLRVGLCAFYPFLIPGTSDHKTSFCQSRTLPVCRTERLVKMIVTYADTSLF